MFTGIIEETGKILNITSNKISVECGTVIENTKLGDSIAINGVCLTVIEILPKGFVADVSPETFRITSLKTLPKDSLVNLERAMPANGRFGGHIVSGHVDGLGQVINIVKNNDFYNIKIELNPEQAKYVVKKGSIAIDGISLTVADVNNHIINLAIIPHTYENTNLKSLKTGSSVNIENDIMAKYIEKFLSTRDNKSNITFEFLQENGF